MKDASLYVFVLYQCTFTQIEIFTDRNNSNNGEERTVDLAKIDTYKPGNPPQNSKSHHHLHL